MEKHVKTFSLGDRVRLNKTYDPLLEGLIGTIGKSFFANKDSEDFLVVLDEALPASKNFPMNGWRSITVSGHCLEKHYDGN